MAEVVTGLDRQVTVLDRQVTVEVDLKRYEELIQAEQKLSMLEMALSKKDSYSNIDDIKDIFDIKKGN